MDRGFSDTSLGVNAPIGGPTDNNESRWSWDSDAVPTVATQSERPWSQSSRGSLGRNSLGLSISGADSFLRGGNSSFRLSLGSISDKRLSSKSLNSVEVDGLGDADLTSWVDSWDNAEELDIHGSGSLTNGSSVDEVSYWKG